MAARLSGRAFRPRTLHGVRSQDVGMGFSRFKTSGAYR